MHADVQALWREIESLRARLDRHERRLDELAPESAPPVPVTDAPTQPDAPAMTVEQFYAELDAIERDVRASVPADLTRSFGPLSAAITLAVDLGARWRAATGLPLPVRPR